MAGAGHEVLAADAPQRASAPAQARANWAILAGCLGVTLVEADLAADDLTKLAEADVVVHLAGRAGVPGSGRSDMRRDNVTATRRLLDACVRPPAVRRPRVIVASSASVYGSAGARPHREDAEPRPASPYAVTKAAVERLAMHAVRARGLSAVVLRYFSVYGPRQRPDMAFHRFVEAGLAGRPLPVLGDGRQSRAFTHVTDVVAATLAAVSTELPGGTVLNVAHPGHVPLHDAIDLLAGLLGVRLAVRNDDPAPGDLARTWGDTGKAADLLGWSARIGLAEGLAGQVAWHRDRQVPRSPRPDPYRR